MRFTAFVSYIAVVAVLALASGAAVGDTSSNTATVINLELKDTPIKDAIAALFQDSGLKYYIQPGVAGKVIELKLKGVTMEQALDAISEAAGLTYKVEDGAYIICPAPKSTEPAKPTVTTSRRQVPASQPALQPGMGPAAQPPMEQRVPMANAVSGNNTATVNVVQPPSAGYAGPPWPSNYSGGYGGAPFTQQYGSMGFYGGYPVVIAGLPSTILRRSPLPPPPDGYVGPDLQRFLRTQYAIQNRTYLSYPSSYPY